MIRLNCFVKLADASRRDAVIKSATQLVEATLKNDEGCHGYDFYASATRPDVFMFCETWESAEALDAHSHKDHFVKLVGEINEVAEMTCEQMEM